MRRLAFVFLILAIPGLLLAQVLATTDSGLRVQLDDDGTWHYVKNEQRTAAADEGVSVQISSLEYVRAPHSSDIVEIYLDYADVQFLIANDSDQDIRALRARFILSDLFGDVVFSFEGDVTNPIAAGDEIVYGWLFPEGDFLRAGGEALRNHRASDLNVAIEDLRIVPAE